MMEPQPNEAKEILRSWLADAETDLLEIANGAKDGESPMAVRVLEAVRFLKSSLVNPRKGSPDDLHWNALFLWIIGRSVRAPLSSALSPQENYPPLDPKEGKAIEKELVRMIATILSKRRRKRGDSPFWAWVRSIDDARLSPPKMRLRVEAKLKAKGKTLPMEPDSFEGTLGKKRRDKWRKEWPALNG